MADPQFLSTLGMKIRELRKQKNLSQNELAAQCNFEKASLSRIECGKTNVTILTLKKISDALDTRIADFFSNGN